jgi:hypothetical protein
VKSIALTIVISSIFMAKLRSIPLYPVNLSVGGIPANLVKNKTPEGKFQVARVLKPGGPQEGEFELLWEGDSESEAEAFARTQVEKDSPGLLTR